MGLCQVLNKVLISVVCEKTASLCWGISEEWVGTWCLVSMALGVGGCGSQQQTSMNCCFRWGILVSMHSLQVWPCLSVFQSSSTNNMCVIAVHTHTQSRTATKGQDRVKVSECCCVGERQKTHSCGESIKIVCHTKTWRTASMTQHQHITSSCYLSSAKHALALPSRLEVNGYGPLQDRDSPCACWVENRSHAIGKIQSNIFTHEGVVDDRQ